MKKAMLVVICLVLAGCDYTVPLVSTPTIDIDRSVIGLWQKSKDGGQAEDLLVLPLSGKEYLVSFPSGTKHAMFARACLWRGEGMTLVQLNWYGTALAKLPEDNRTYQFASYSVKGDEMRIRLLNKDVVKKDIGSSEELVKAIANNKSNSYLFRDEMLFKKVKN